MPLGKNVGKNIEKLKKEGYTSKRQIIAIALSAAGKKKNDKNKSKNS